MFGVACFYLIVGSIYFIRKRLEMPMTYVHKRFDITFLVIGAINLIASICNLFYESFIWMFIGSIAVLIGGWFMLKTFTDWNNARMIMDELTKEEK